MAPLLWPFIDESTRKYFGTRHAFFSANNHITEKKYAREFLNVVDGLKYISDQQRAIEVLSIIDELENTHSGLNNFYSEALPAKRLASIVGTPASIPVGAELKYVSTLVNVFLTNGYGVANSANNIYTDLLNELTPKQSIYALTQIFDERISSKLRIKLCEIKFSEMVGIIEKKISTHAAKQLISEIKSDKYILSDIREEQHLRKLANDALTEVI